MVRFRLKKSLPFDVDKARVSYHSQKSKDGVRVVAAVAAGQRGGGLRSGLPRRRIQPRSGACLPCWRRWGAAEGQRPTLVVKVDARTTSIAILNADQLQLFRTLENTRGVTITGDQLAEEVYPSVVFFQDTYHLNIEKIFVAGNIGHGQRGSGAARANRRGGAGVGERLAVGSEHRRFGAALENGGSGGSVDFVRAVVSGRWSVLRQIDWPPTDH